MTFAEILEGQTIRTGDIIATVDGDSSFYGLLFKIIGEIVPGKPDHLAIYLGPDGICIEAAPKGVNLFRFFNGRWDTGRMQGQRGVVDRLYGMGDVLSQKIDGQETVESAREGVRAFALDQVGKPYNMNFLDPEQKSSYYCSQLAYAAYKSVGLDLCLRNSMPLHPMLSHRVITPEEVWRSLSK